VAPDERVQVVSVIRTSMLYLAVLLTSWRSAAAIVKTSPGDAEQPAASCSLDSSRYPGLLVSYARGILTSPARQSTRSAHGLTLVESSAFSLDSTSVVCGRVYALYRAHWRLTNPSVPEPNWGPARFVVARATPYWVYSRVMPDGAFTDDYGMAVANDSLSRVIVVFK
jgi:hypothetical protein